VLLDVVMNHDNQCPLRRLDLERYFLRSRDDEPGRGDDYGQKLFRYREPHADGTFPARDFHSQWAEFLIREYHIDGFRIDEFRGIDNWEFVQEFRDRAWRVHQLVFPDRPFLVIAEDSWRRAVTTRDDPHNPNGRKVTDAIWNFTFRDETRRLLLDEIRTAWGEPSRRDRVRWCITGWQTWDDYGHSVQPGFRDMAQAVNYLTSHDVEGESEKRILNFLLAPLLRQGGFDSGLSDIRWVADHLRVGHGEEVATDGQRFLHGVALERLRSAFALLLTAVGIPMILAGDEFGDVHDVDHSNWRLKMSDPIDWDRRHASPNNLRLWADVRSLIALRKTHPALLRNEVDFFWFHPAFDGDGGERVFAYCRTAGKELGRSGQVVVVVNASDRDYPSFDLPWRWASSTAREVAPPAYRLELAPRGDGSWARISLAPFQVRVFES
jgi:1,4-alpha-glucan branching enzyme